MESVLKFYFLDLITILRVLNIDTIDRRVRFWEYVAKTEFREKKDAVREEIRANEIKEFYEQQVFFYYF